MTFNVSYGNNFTQVMGKIFQSTMYYLFDRYTELMKKMEYEGSVLSDHELRHLKDL